jgi:hypothetical protein
MKPDYLPLYLKCKNCHKGENMKILFLSFAVNLLILIELLNLLSRKSHIMAIITYGYKLCFRKYI